MADLAGTADDLMGREVATMFDKDGFGKSECRAGDTGCKSAIPNCKIRIQMKLDTAVVNGRIPKIGRDKMDPRDVAGDRVSGNMKNVNGWIN